MKLLYKTSLYYALASLLFFVIAGFIISSNFNKVIENDVNDFLINREEIATTQIVNGVLLSSLNNYEQIVKITDRQNALDKIVFKDTTLYDIIGDEFHNYKKLEVTRKIGDNLYDITIFKSSIKTNILITEVLKSLIIVFLGLLTFLIFGNLLISNSIWKPFKNTLSKLENYELASTKSVDFNKTNTQEFNQLNTMLNTLITKIHTDYLNMKEFTENAAHEIQTPLAIIRSKCEMLLQSDSLTEVELNHTKSIFNSCLRLSKINRGLSLLAKIESGAYEATEKVNVTEILQNQIAHYSEIVELNNLQLKARISNEIYYDINPELTEILISNFIRNAIKHNIQGGEIAIHAYDNMICFSNSGEQKEIDKSQFERFNRSSLNSLGLGLSIVDKVCKLYTIKLKYTYDNNTHNFQLIF